MESRVPELLVSGPAGTGKAQPLDALVLTPTGPVPMGSLGVGDLVLSPSGDAIKIVDVPFRGVAPVYRVTLSDGSTVECSDGHIWAVEFAGVTLVRSLAELLPTLRHRGGQRPTYALPMTAPVEFERQDVPIPAYTLGVLLGDGYLRPGEVSFTSADSELAARVAAEMAPRYRLVESGKADNAALNYRIVPDGWKTRRASTAKTGYISMTSSGKFMARVREIGGRADEAKYIGSYLTREDAQAAIDAAAVGLVDDAGDGIHQDVESLGLRNSRSATKFVPDVYKYNTAEVRLQMLRGLMDTDGYAGPTEVTFTSISEQLADDVRWLVESLGGFAKVATKQPSNGQLAYTVWIRFNDGPALFALERKRRRALVRKRPVKRWIESAEYVGDRECQCITVEREDGMYLTERFVPTHNSRALLEKIHLCMMKYPKAKGLILRKVASSLAGSGLQTWEEFVVAEAMASGEVTFFGGSKREPAQYRYRNGSTVAVAGLDDPTKIMSTEFDIAYVQESTELVIRDWEFVNVRLRNGRMPYQQLIADANPNAPTHWLKQRCDRGACVMLDSRHEENPILFDDDGVMTERGRQYMQRLDALTGVRYLRLRKGIWAAAEGLIYEMFDPKVHVIKRFPIPDAWPRFWSVDFGFVHPFVLQCWTQDPDGRLIMYREIYRSKKTVDEHCFDIMAEVSTPDPGYVHPPGTQRFAHQGRIWTEPRPARIITDHDAESRRTLERHLGQGTKIADKRVTEGIQQVQRRFRLLPDGSPNIAFMRDALVHRDEDLEGDGKPTSTVEEMPAYRWLKRGTLESPSDKRPVDEPLKENDHGCDCVRYLTMDRDPIKRVGLRTVGA